MLQFDWDGHNTAHIARHKISRQEIEEVLAGETLEYPAHSRGKEPRFAFVGPTAAGRLLFVVVTYRANLIRPVTAFDARRPMKKEYAEYFMRRIK